MSWTKLMNALRTIDEISENIDFNGPDGAEVEKRLLKEEIASWEQYATQDSVRWAQARERLAEMEEQNAEI